MRVAVSDSKRLAAVLLAKPTDISSWADLHQELADTQDQIDAFVANPNGKGSINLTGLAKYLSLRASRRKDGTGGFMWYADIRVHLDGKFVHASSILDGDFNLGTYPLVSLTQALEKRDHIISKLISVLSNGVQMVMDMKEQMDTPKASPRRIEAASRGRNAVDHPAHYQQFKHEVIELCRLLPFDDGNVVKYILRAGAKGAFDEDIRKAIWYAIDSCSSPDAPYTKYPPKAFELAKAFAEELANAGDKIRAEALTAYVIERDRRRAILRLTEACRAE